MKPLPDHQSLAALVSKVTQPMLGIGCVASHGYRPEEFYCTAVLPIPGQKEGVVLALSSSQAGCVRLGSAMFSVEEDEVDDSIISDTLSELANMAAGQLKGMLGLTQALGLPRILTETELSARADNGWSHYPLMAGEVSLIVSVSTETSTIAEYC